MELQLKQFIRKIGLFPILSIIRKSLFPYESEKTFNKHKRFYSRFIQSGDLCFDVGANVGNKSFLFLELGARVIAIEPQQGCCKILHDRFGNKITIINTGCSAKEESKEFYVSSASTISSFSKEWIDSVKHRHHGYSWNITDQINVTTLDILIQQHGNPVYCKIDVEGYELEVLKGLTKPIKIISFEYTVPEQIDNAINCIMHLNTLGSIACNYTRDGDIQFVLKKWLAPSEMISLIKNPDFIKTSVGEIYIKTFSI